MKKLYKVSNRDSSIDLLLPSISLQVLVILYVAILYTLSVWVDDKNAVIVLIYLERFGFKNSVHQIEFYNQYNIDLKYTMHALSS
jgi:hypothetical protein